MWVAFGSSLVVYLLTILLLKNYLDIYFIFNDAGTFFKIPLISLVAWAPFFIGTLIKKKCFPETIEKLNQARNLELKTDINLDIKNETDLISD